jgi:class 3 adenylate cyclase
VLPAVRVPALILCAPERRGPAEYTARHIQGAELQELPTMRGEFTWTDDATHEACMSAVSAFVQRLHPHAEPDRILTTLLFTDIVGSTELAARLGDRAWGELLEAHHTRARAELARYRGREVDVAGDGFLATFDGPARAIGCALAIIASMEELGIAIRAGVHTGEVEMRGEAVRGIAVHVGARVGAAAEPGTVYATSTVRLLTAGSGLVFEDRGEHDLKGVPDRWRLYRVVPEP